METKLLRKELQDNLESLFNNMELKYKEMENARDFYEKKCNALELALVKHKERIAELSGLCNLGNSK